MLRKPLDTELRPSLKSSGFNEKEIDIIFGFFFQNFIVPQMVYDALLLEKNAAPNSNYYLANYENVLFAYHYWMDQSDKAEQKELLYLVLKILERINNPVSKNEIFSIYIAENQSLIESNFIHWLYFQAYILSDITDYVVHTSFGDYIGYLLEDLK
ncbi:MAG: hypothetical protein EA409_13450 [Saprospirales bacterium]|nr:MAG: hypothetical protein EA409_13450 [Saprospirales bacterium]